MKSFSTEAILSLRAGRLRPSAETWHVGGSYQNATYDDYNYEYRWTKTWQGQGAGAASSLATNHVTGLEDGAATGWWS
ncbi:MAG TPA: hypothetical protein PKI05_13455 [Thermogutta sp.]|nr:hypothetical protein [Thermogutta sp.]HQF14958.1 hypothetical protein [Thermogutta sp.]